MKLLASEEETIKVWQDMYNNCKETKKDPQKMTQKLVILSQHQVCPSGTQILGRLKNSYAMTTAIIS